MLTGLLVFCVLALPTRAQTEEHRVGLGFGLGRSYQIGTPGGSIARPYQRFRNGSNHLLTLWYENEKQRSPWVLRGGFSWARRGYWLSQDQFANRWFREAYFNFMPRYDYLGLWMSAGYRLLNTDRLKLEGFAGLSISLVSLNEVAFTYGYEGAYVTPLEHRGETEYRFSEREYTAVESILGLNLRWRTERKLFRRLSYWLSLSLPVNSLDYVGFRLEERYLDQATVYEGRWRTRMANWSVGIAYDLLTWGRLRHGN